MNKKGFTLIELLAVITLIAIISVIAVPNIVRMIDSSKREEFVSNSKNMISKAKYMFKFVDGKYKDSFVEESGCQAITLKNLDLDTEEDPDGNSYDLNFSKVKICIISNKQVYYVKTMSKDKEGFDTRGIYNLTTEDNYIEEITLSKDSVNNKN